MKKNNTALKLCAACAMLLLPLPLILLFDCAAFKNVAAWRYLLYYSLSFIPVSAGYFLIKFKRAQNKPKTIFTANILIGLTAVLLAVLTIIAVNTAAGIAESYSFFFNQFNLYLALLPAVLFWFMLGTRLYKKSFSDIFTPIFLGLYIAETFLCYISCAVMSDDIKSISTAADIMVYLMIVIALLTVLLINQSNIETQISKRKNTNLIVPKGLKQYNAKLISIVGIFILAALLLKDYIAAGISWFILITLKIIDAVLFGIKLQNTQTMPPEDDKINVGSIFGIESGQDFIIYIVLIAVIILAIVFRKQIFAFIKSLAGKIFGRLSTDNSEENAAYDYTDYYEAIDLKPEKIVRLTSDDCLKKYRREKKPTEKYRLGYRLYIMWLSKHSRSVTGSMTVEQHTGQAEKLYHGNESIGDISNSYTNIRYDDKAADASDIDKMDRLIKELYK